MKGVVVIGSATVDEVKQDGITVLKMGGVVTYGGITFRRHGLQTSVVCNIAKQDDGLFRIFREQSIHLFNGVTETTTVFVNWVNGDERRQEMPVQAAPITTDQAERAIEDADLVHLGPLHPADIETDVLTLLAKRGISITLDVQGYVRQVDKGQVRLGVSEDLHHALLASSVIKTDSTELQAILSARKIGIEELINVYRLDELLITAGSEGGRVVAASGEVVNYKAARVRQVLDTIGAGDVFFGAYICSRLHEHRSIRQSCEYAALVAAQQVQGRYIMEDTLRLSR